MTRLGPGREFDLVRALTAGAEPRPPGVLVGPGDDCAVLDGGVVVTCDMVVEDVHFRRAWLTPVEIGYRAAAAALSDLAAMAASPVATLVAYALPADDTEVAAGLQRGVGEICGAVGAPVVGGDVTRSPGPLVLDIVAVGRSSSPVLRSGARPGDAVWVTGSLGGAAGAVADLLRGRTPDPVRRDRFARPRPRIAEARWLADRWPLRALIDLSDGLAGDAAHVAAASGVTLVLETEAIPAWPGPGATGVEPGEALRLALSGGEDYELLLACPSDSDPAVAGAFEERFAVPMTRIGRVVERGPEPVLLQAADGSTRPPERGGFDHFAAPGPPGEGPAAGPGGPPGAPTDAGRSP